ncbi:Oidioi.mRNA.OKI2018_I69.PAR.g10449.t1.cds [Oikopleura dioica]|uniref:Oidioi.mRNA.OKI2018_I69.PAR.g10449.t1.cds n=1 Tax=Oikopleura dioica TaxID=34765 RepID=A0ABN7RRK4_OIKDI|nr:Oidioi.mRNA.OKI2018_I69.PAR.g10449.t1.cds [Oikopleura dioica]
MERQIEETNKSTTVHSELRLLSIGIGSNFGYQRFLIRRNDENDGAKELVQRFVDEIESLAVAEENYLPSELRDSIQNLQNIDMNSVHAEQKMKIRYLRRELTNYAKMDIFGFNSAKFDLKVLSPYLIPILMKKHGSKFTSIKKGSHYFSMSTPKYQFKDAKLFSTPTDLAGYLKQGGVDEGKAIWPYEKYHSVFDIMNDKNFPPREDFFSSLKNKAISEEDYEIFKDEFNKNQRRDPHYSMAHWLQHYNLADVTPFAKAIDNQFKLFFETFKIDPSFCMSLPKFAMACVFEGYSKDSPLTFSFHRTCHKEHKLLRDNIIGGLVNVYSRYTELRPEVDAPRNAKFAPNGDPFTKIVFFDFNALYLYAQKMLLPSTPGIRWQKIDNTVFRKSIMTSDNSLAALQWLTYIDEFSPLLVQTNGERVRLEHQYFRGEHQVLNYKIDGYACVDGQHHYFEFLGCYFHQYCVDCNPGQIDHGFEKKRRILSRKGTVHIMRECEWVHRRNKYYVDRVSKYWGHIFKLKESEKSILEGIKNDEIYGFIEADVSCPKEVFDQISYINFPPVIQRMKITDEHLSSYMKAQFEKTGSKCDQETVVQTYNATKSLSDYANNITNGRVNALDANNSALALAFKTIGNCGGFGKAIEQVDRPNTKFNDDKQLKKSIVKPTYKSSEALCQENGEYEISEVIFDKLRIKDDKPTVLGVAILQNSKLHFLSFVYNFLHKYLRPGSYKLNYCDTDSLAISFTRSGTDGQTTRSQMEAALLPCVREELMEEFLQVWHKWIVLEDTTLNHKTPGLLKERADLEALRKEYGGTYLPLAEEELDFFRQTERVGQLHNRLIIPPPKPGRIVETAHLRLLLNKNFDLNSLIEDIFDVISPVFRIKIDFGFLMENILTEDPDSRYRFHWPQISTGLPIEPHLIKDKFSKKAFLENIPSWSEIPQMVEIEHENQSSFRKSGFNLTKLLTCSVYVTKMK